MSLENMTIVVGGGTGDVGVGIVDALADRGAQVLVPTRSKEKGQRLLDSVARPDQVSLLPATPTDDASTMRLVEALGSVGQIDGVIASLGSWFSFGRLVDTPADGFETAWRSLLFSHFLFAKAMVPLLKPGARYILVNGGGSEAPVPHSSPTSIHAHGVSMLFETLKAEHPELRLHMLMLRSIIATRARPEADPSWVSARDVGEASAWLLTDQGALTAGSVLGLQEKLVFDGA